MPQQARRGDRSRCEYGFRGSQARVDQCRDKLRRMPMHSVERWDRRPVGDRPCAYDLVRRPCSTRRLDDPRAGRISDEETGPVGPFNAHVSSPALPVAFEQRGDDLDSLAGGGPAFEREADEVHAGKRRCRRSRVERRVNRFVADGDRRVVHAGLEPPTPTRTKAEDAERLDARRGNTDVCADERFTIPSSREPLQGLRLGRRTIRALGEQRLTERGCGRQCDEAITHGSAFRARARGGQARVARDRQTKRGGSRTRNRTAIVIRTLVTCGFAAIEDAVRPAPVHNPPHFKAVRASGAGSRPAALAGSRRRPPAGSCG